MQRIVLSQALRASRRHVLTKGAAAYASRSTGLVAKRFNSSHSSSSSSSAADDKSTAWLFPVSIVAAAAFVFQDKLQLSYYTEKLHLTKHENNKESEENAGKIDSQQSSNGSSSEDTPSSSDSEEPATPESSDSELSSDNDGSDAPSGEEPSEKEQQESQPPEEGQSEDKPEEKSESKEEDKKDAASKGESASEGEAQSQAAAFNPETGEINWDCPCLGGMATGPCGEEFKAAFSCFVYSEADPKGIDCIEKFQGMQECFRKYPEVYAEELRDDEVPIGDKKEDQSQEQKDQKEQPQEVQKKGEPENKGQEGQQLTQPEGVHEAAPQTSKKKNHADSTENSEPDSS